MLPMSSPDVNPGAVETQQMRVIAPAGVSEPLLRPFECQIHTVHLLGQCASAATDILQPRRTADPGPGRLRRLPAGPDGCFMTRAYIDGSYTVSLFSMLVTHLYNADSCCVLVDTDHIPFVSIFSPCVCALVVVRGCTDVLDREAQDVHEQ